MSEPPYTTIWVPVTSEALTNKRSRQEHAQNIHEVVFRFSVTYVWIVLLNHLYIPHAFNLHGIYRLLATVNLYKTQLYEAPRNQSIENKLCVLVLILYYNIIFPPCSMGKCLLFIWATVKQCNTVANKRRTCILIFR